MEENDKMDILEQEENNEESIEITIKKKSNNKGVLILVISLIFILLIIVFIGSLYSFNNKDDNNENNFEINSEIKKSPYWISSNSLENFDLHFLQLEKTPENKVYSPLSIKYALGMLKEGTEGQAKSQIESIIGEYQIKKYNNSENMSFANSIFVKNTYKDSIKDSYITTLTKKYNAEVQFDSFTSPNVVNSWVNNKTLGLISNLYSDISDKELLLINALAIDMEWEEKFMKEPGFGVVVEYSYENFGWKADENILPAKFKNIEEEISSLEIAASFNNYDIVNVLGEESIRETVKQAFEEYLKEYPTEKIENYIFGEDDQDLNDEQLMEKYLDQYIERINSNYKREDKTTDFSFYIDGDIKAFAKDLKEYDGTTLQYIAIMPTNENLSDYINNINFSKVNNIINNLKELKVENFKDGVVTKINGYIPKFKFEYNLNLMDDLKKLGITNVFEMGKANLTNITSDSKLYIADAIHKSNIEFSQDGIKASAATEFGGAGADRGFYYAYDVPVEEVDLTFDKPYMFIIRDKNTGEVWFVGTLYNPLLYSEDTTIAILNK